MPVNISENKEAIETAITEIEDKKQAGMFSVYLAYACQKVDDVNEAIRLAHGALNHTSGKEQ